MSQRPQFKRRHPAPSAEEINALRLAAGLTISRMARVLGVSPSSVEAWLYGQNIMPEPIWKLTKILCTPKKRRANKKPVNGLGQDSSK